MKMKRMIFGVSVLLLTLVAQPAQASPPTILLLRVSGDGEPQLTAALRDQLGPALPGEGTLTAAERDCDEPTCLESIRARLQVPAVMWVTASRVSNRHNLAVYLYDRPGEEPLIVQEQFQSGDSTGIVATLRRAVERVLAEDHGRGGPALVPPPPAPPAVVITPPPLRPPPKMPSRWKPWHIGVAVGFGVLGLGLSAGAIALSRASGRPTSDASCLFKWDGMLVENAQSQQCINDYRSATTATAVLAGTAFASGLITFVVPLGEGK